jgi:hypothetical protein
MIVVVGAEFAPNVPELSWRVSRYKTGAMYRERYQILHYLRYGLPIETCSE